ncbi:hypothetical protein QYZ88_015250 [Lachnospiraceae bacterium C1.1]|nr:hypothetical protein [Lachnospiraceae bacterium C1.1]
MKKWGVCIFLLISTAAFMTGCGSQQLDISEEDEERVVNYAATVLDEHNASSSHTLANLSEKDLERIVKLDLAAAARKAELEEETEEAAEEKSEDGNDNPDSENNSDASAEGEGAEAKEAAKSIAEAIGLSGFDISYNGYEICTEYPNSDEEGVFAISTGSSQDSLLVMHFNVFNPNSETMNCDILDLKPMFRASISGQKHSLLTTLLLNDLAMLNEDIEAGQTLDAVLIAEITNEKAEEISSLGLIIRSEDGNYEIQLE